MSPKTPNVVSEDSSSLETASKVDQFLESVAERAPPTRSDGTSGRLIFAMDATASRQASWDRAMSLQSDMFMGTRSIGALEVQLVYYRGYRECQSSKWLKEAATLVRLMSKVHCVAGRTQLARVLEHGLAEARQQRVQALVLIGDAAEEPIDTLGDLAGRLKLMGLPVFVFQEGNDRTASQVFASIASLSGGAHCQFSENSASELGELLNAVAAYAAGGKRALASLSSQSARATHMLEQLG